MNNHLSEKSIDVRKPDKVAYVNLFRAAVPELFPDDDARRENFRIIIRRSIIIIYRESYRYRIV